MDDTRSLHQIITNYRIRLRLLEAEEKSHIIYQKRRNTESYRLYSSEILVCKKTLDAFMLLPSQCEYSENKNMLNTMWQNLNASAARATRAFASAVLDETESEFKTRDYHIPRRLVSKVCSYPDSLTIETESELKTQDYHRCSYPYTLTIDTPQAIKRPTADEDSVDLEAPTLRSNHFQPPIRLSTDREMPSSPSSKKIVRMTRPIQPLALFLKEDSVDLDSCIKCKTMEAYGAPWFSW